MNLSFFAIVLLVRNILQQTHGDEFAAKMNRPNFPQRVVAVGTALRMFGPSEKAAEAIIGWGWFTGLSVEVLTGLLNEAIAKLKAGGVYKFSEAEMGDFNVSVAGHGSFSQPVDDEIEEEEETNN